MRPSVCAKRIIFYILCLVCVSGRVRGGKSYVCAAEKGSPFGEAENFQALESRNPRTFWYLSYDPIDGQDIFELRVLDE